MAITRDDTDQISNILSWKISDGKINKIIDTINKESFYYDLKDSPFNRPTVAKVFSLAIFLVCVYFFIVNPLFFTKSASVTTLVNQQIVNDVKYWQLPPVSSFEYQVYLKNTSNNGDNFVLQIADKKGNIISKADIINWYWTAIFGSLGGQYQLKNDINLINTTKWELEIDKRENIKDLIQNWLKYDIYTPKFESIDYWVDTIINSAQQ